jgi:hypothetical protein
MSRTRFCAPRGGFVLDIAICSEKRWPLRSTAYSDCGTTVDYASISTKLPPAPESDNTDAALPDISEASVV